MKSLPARPSARSLAISVVLALLPGTALSLCARTPQARADQPGPADRAAVLTNLYTTVNNGDAAGGAALFAANAVFIGALTNSVCAQTAPCTDSAGILRQLTGVVGVHTCVVINSINVSGAVVTGQLQTSYDLQRAIGIDRVIQSFIAVVPSNQITFFANVADVGDPQTARSVAIAAGTEPAGAPIPTPTSCTGS